MRKADPIPSLFERILTPIARLAMARGLNHGALSEIMKKAFLRSATQDFRLEEKRLTQSRLSLLTGLQRREIKRLEALEEGLEPNRAARVHSHLLALKCDRITIEEYDQIARALYKDMHPRTFLDELERLGLIEVTMGEVILFEKAFIPAQGSLEQMQVFVDNIEAHAGSAVGNILGDEKQLERAFFIKGIYEDDLQLLEKYAAEEMMAALANINRYALKLQNNRRGQGAFRVGVYSRREDEDEN